MIDKYNVKIHHSLIIPILIAGIPRKLAIINSTVFLSLILGAQIFILIPIFIFTHFIFIILTKKDPQILDIIINYIKQKDFYDI